MKVQRKHERYSYELDVEVIFENDDLHQARLLNFSLGGAFVQIDTLPAFASKVTLLIDLPGVPERCRIPCYVRWIKDKETQGMGIQFQYTRPIEVWALSKLIRKIKEGDGETSS